MSDEERKSSPEDEQSSSESSSDSSDDEPEGELQNLKSCTPVSSVSSAGRLHTPCTNLPLSSYPDSLPPATYPSTPYPGSYPSAPLPTCANSYPPSSYPSAGYPAMDYPSVSELPTGYPSYPTGLMSVQSTWNGTSSAHK